MCAKTAICRCVALLQREGGGSHGEITVKRTVLGEPRFAVPLAVYLQGIAHAQTVYVEDYSYDTYDEPEGFYSDWVPGVHYCSDLYEYYCDEQYFDVFEVPGTVVPAYTDCWCIQWPAAPEWGVLYLNDWDGYYDEGSNSVDVSAYFEADRPVWEIDSCPWGTCSDGGIAGWYLSFWDMDDQAFTIFP